MWRLYQKNASVKTLLKESNLPLFKNNSLKTNHAQFFKKNNLEKKLNKCLKLA